MKKMIAVVAVCASALMACGGSPNCDALKKLCDGCANDSGKSACNTTYTTYTTVGGSAGDTSCKTVVDAKTYAADSTVCKK